MFRIINIDVSGIKEAAQLIREYSDAVTSKDISAKITDDKQRQLEKYVGTTLLTGARIVSGKIGQKQSTDYLLPSDSGIIKALYNDALMQSSFVRAEFKGSTSGGGSTIGQITLGNSRKTLYIPGEEESFTAGSVKEKILGKRLGSKSGYLVDLDPNLSKAKDVSAYIFNNYFKKDPRLKELFYQKASTLLLANSYYINDSSGARIIGINVPKQYFSPVFFKASIEGKAIVVSIKDNFQNSFIRELNESIIDREKAKKGYKKSIKVGSKVYKIDYLPVRSGQEFFGLEITNSIKARPVDTFILRAPAAKPATNPAKNPQKFISSAQWTFLVQKRLGDSMLSFGDPEPPDIKERSGRFRSSVAVTADYKRKLIQYTYNPLYRSLEHYGYHPELQVERSIRQVAQELYAREFSIMRRGSLA